MCLPSRKTAASGVEVICKAEGLFDPMALQPVRIVASSQKLETSASFLSIAFKLTSDRQWVQASHFILWDVFYPL